MTGNCDTDPDDSPNEVENGTELKTLSLQAIKAFIVSNQRSRGHQFWFMQVLGWGGLCVVTFLSLTLWYNTIQVNYVGHVFLQSFMGLILSLPLRRAYLAIWNRSISWRVLLTLAAIVVISALWTALRIWTFTLMTSEQDVWSDFGGWYFASFMVFLCWSSLYYGNKYYFKAQEEYRKRMLSMRQTESEHIRRLSAEAEAREAQLKMLRYQLNPHFLFNTLNNIGALVKFQETAKASRMIVQLGDFLRFSLDSDPTVMITLEQELDALMLYLNIEKTRLGNRLNLVFNVSEQAKSAKVPALLLQPLIENSIKYAISKNEDGGTIELKAIVEHGELKIELTDGGPDGVGQKEKRQKRGRRVGLHNTLERLKTLYKDAYLFDIGLRDAGGLRVRINIPFDSGKTSEINVPDKQKGITA
jgi:two-component system LytT family sensor kinase